MLIQIFAFAMCFFGLTVGLMVQQLPEHRKIAADIAPGVTAQTSGDRCDGFHGESGWACHAMARADSDFEEDEPQEEPELD